MSVGGFGSHVLLQRDFCAYTTFNPSLGFEITLSHLFDRGALEAMARRRWYLYVSSLCQ